MNPRDFHQLASELCQGNRAVNFRTAISRAYYAVYNVGFEILSGMGFRLSTGSAGHGDVRNRLSNSGEEQIVSIGSKLSTLESMRIKADYKLDRKDVENPKTAQAIVRQVEEIIQTLDTFCSGPDRDSIIRAIKEWEQKIYDKI